MKSTYFSSVLLFFVIISLNPLALFSSTSRVHSSEAIALTTKLPYNFKKPPNRGTPGTDAAGGSRGDCKVTDPRQMFVLKAIVPIASDKTVGGVTASAQPDFWFSSTFPADCVTLEFVLKNDRGLPLYRAPVIPTVSNSVSHPINSLTDSHPVPSKPFAVKLPSSIALKTGQTYRWALLAKFKNNPTEVVNSLIQLRANAKDNPPIVVSGSVQRVKVNAIDPNAEPLLRAKLYAEQGIWHEAVSLVQSILEKTPDDPAAQAFWNAIVQDAGITPYNPTP